MKKISKILVYDGFSDYREGNRGVACGSGLKRILGKVHLPNRIHVTLSTGKLNQTSKPIYFSQLIPGCEESVFYSHSGNSWHNTYGHQIFPILKDNFGLTTQTQLKLFITCGKA